MPATTDDKAPRELLALDVGEVSLVDAAANKRRFLITKRLEPIMPASDPTKTEFITKTGELLASLSKERLGLIAEKVTALMGGVGTMSKEEVRSAFSTIYNTMYSAENDVIALAKSMEGAGLLEAGTADDLVEKAGKAKVEAAVDTGTADVLAAIANLHATIEAARKPKVDPDDPAVEEGVTKAKRMTPTRIAQLKTHRDGIDALLKDIEGTEEEAASEATVAAAVTKAVDPLTTELALAKAARATSDAQVTALTTEVSAQKALVTTQTAELVELRKQVEALQAAPLAGGNDGADPSVAVVKKSVFKGIV
jgi:hypothetical protein